jgi:uncharacterized membrane protein YhhN
MSAMKIFLYCFFLNAVLHIVFIILDKETLRRISKILIVPLLLAVYIAGAGIKFVLPIFALVLGWIGDVLLLRIDKKNYLNLGLASFLLGHLCYIISFLQILGFFGFENAIGSINILAIVIFVPPAIVLGVVVFRLIKPLKELYIPVILYMTFLEILTLFGFQVSLFNPGFAGLLILSGCLCFMISDTILAYYTFRKLKRSGSVFLMGYYMLAQAEIILGIMMLKAGPLF